MSPEEKKRDQGHWPFDPLQPGDHEPVRLPEELKRVQKQTGAGERASQESPGKERR